MLLPNETILKAISWTLLHSMWQGLILAVLAGLVILFTKKAKANLRYNILSGLFLAFMVGVGFTFNYEYQKDVTFVAAEEFVVMEDLNQEAVFLPASEAPDYFQLAIDFFNQNSKAIVLIWFLIFSMKCFGIFKSLSNIYRIRNYRNQAVPEYWSQRVLELSQILKIKKKITLLESQLVSVPSVTGFFKPIILIPIGLLSNLPQDQIEAILLHELAHIRRKDYFINLIQSFAEILFFFNPGVLWVSSIIKEERESCCDDIAVQITQSKSKFINALVSFQEYNMKQNQLSMGFGGRKNQLLERAKRIIHDNNKSLNAIEKTFLSICIIIIASFTVACSNTKAAGFQAREDVAFAGVHDTIAEFAGISEKEQAMMEVEMESEQAMAEVEAEAEEARAEAETARVEAEEAMREAKIAAAEATLSEQEIKEIQKEAEEAVKQSEIARMESTKMRIESAKMRLESAKARMESDKARMEGEGARWEAQKARLEAQKAKLEAQRAKMEADLKKMETRFGAEKTRKVSGSSVITRESTTDVNGVKSSNKIVIYADENPSLSLDNISKEIIDNLMAENVISSDKNLSYKLSNSELIVNNKIVSEKVRQKLQKYLSPNISAVYYNFDVDSKDKK